MDFVKGADLPRTRASVRRVDRCAIGRVRVKGFRVPGATGVWRFPAMTWLGPYAAAREGTFGEEDLREYCEVCNHHWHREYVTWFAHPFETEDGRYVNSACGGCFRQVPVGHGPVV